MWAVLGPAYIDLAFYAAAEADQGARMIWNQNYLQSEDPGDRANRQAMLVSLRGSSATVFPSTASASNRTC